MTSPRRRDGGRCLPTISSIHRSCAVMAGIIVLVMVVRRFGLMWVVVFRNGGGIHNVI